MTHSLITSVYKDLGYLNRIIQKRISQYFPYLLSESRVLNNKAPYFSGKAFEHIL
ncbi:Protein of unknown function [Pyronema omphalodes CBS 100304]|uniref:Uncharacterized protein n=1 Tax=Pyronema omphalodes (strain CBS 100304) TaxID=1076935 RepID=U4L4N1_PYROM|nr:Protein of unknown function [Pyronema omphalodes CBS 100304]